MPAGIHMREIGQRTCVHCSEKFQGSKGSKYCSVRCKLWARSVDEGACRVWTGTFTNVGYGSFKSARGVKTQNAHKASYEAFVGPIGPKEWVLHRCDNRRCIRPEHLFLGSPHDNMQDALAKGRIPLGQDKPQTKLTEDQVRELRASSESSKAVAKRLGVHPTTVREIRRRLYWKHV